MTDQLAPTPPQDEPRQLELPAEAQAYELTSDQKLGLTVTHENGAQEVGVRAARQIGRQIVGKDMLPPKAPNEGLGITVYHDDGSIDTGTRAVRNIARSVAGKKPKVYKRTFQPVE